MGVDPAAFTDGSAPRIGVLALQGAFEEHVAILEACGAEAFQVKLPHQMEGLDGLVIPGGESTAMANIAERWGMVDPIRTWIRKEKKPTWGTCAGLIMVAEKIEGAKQDGQLSFGGLDVDVMRNYFGSQIDSFELTIHPKVQEAIINDGTIVAPLEVPSFDAVFIRAPIVTRAGKDVKVLATVNVDRKDGTFEEVVVAVKQEHILGTSFHPELTNDHRWHQYFMAMVNQSRCNA